MKQGEERLVEEQVRGEVVIEVKDTSHFWLGGEKGPFRYKVLRLRPFVLLRGI